MLRVKFWVALLPIPLLAVNVIGYAPGVFATPLSVAVPLPLSTKVTPVGSVPASVMEGVGLPVAVITNVTVEPAVNEALLMLVMAGAWFTVSVKVCVASAPMPLCALMLSEYVPPIAAAGVPAMVAVPFLLSTKVTPVGSAPVSVKEGAGKPVVVTENVPAVPTVNFVLLALVMAAA